MQEISNAKGEKEGGEQGVGEEEEDEEGGNFKFSFVYCKILLALAPGFVEPPCRLIQVSLGVYRVFQMFFRPAEFPGYHQCQQESQ